MILTGHIGCLGELVIDPGGGAPAKEGTDHDRAILATLRRIADLNEHIVPICASCGRVRDERGIWLIVARHVRLCADVSFSHGICPDCMRALYPDYV
jgi:hypothetical protein